jgi:ribosomal protein S18 acetylase RimI-like enzyme
MAPEGLVRKATSKDLAWLVSSFQDFGKLVGDDTLCPAELIDRNVALLLDDPQTDFCVALDSAGSCAGMLQQRYRHSVWLSGLEANIEDLYVTESVRGKGFGRALMHRALAEATERGCLRVVLDTNESNTVARSLYEELGFSHTREQPDPGRMLLYVRPLP